MSNARRRSRSALVELGLVLESARTLAAAFSSAKALEALSLAALRAVPRAREISVALWDRANDQVVDVFYRSGATVSALGPDIGHPLAA